MPMSTLQKLKLTKDFLFHCKVFPLRERIEVVNRLTNHTSIGDLFLRRVEKDEQGRRYANVNGDRFYFEPEYKVKDDKALLGGIAQVLTETYVFPDLFSPEVSINQGDIVFDLGANMGTNVVLFSRLAGNSGHVYAFEPITNVTLERNVQANHLENVTIVPKGVWSEPDELTFALTDATLDSRVSLDETKASGENTVKVELITLDDFVKEYQVPRVDFIKMDIEGAEEDAILGAKELVAKHRPKWSISSYHTDPRGEKQFPRLKKLLTELGYNIATPSGHSRILAW